MDGDKSKKRYTSAAFAARKLHLVQQPAINIFSSFHHLCTPWKFWFLYTWAALSLLDIRIPFWVSSWILAYCYFFPFVPYSKTGSSLSIVLLPSFLTFSPYEMSSSPLIRLSLRPQFSLPHILQTLSTSLYCRTLTRIPPVDCRD